MVARKGAAEAGTVFLKIYAERDAVHLLGPPPGAVHGADGTRKWHFTLGRDAMPEQQADDYLQRQLSFDPDIWIVDIEGRAALDDIAGDIVPSDQA